LWLRAGWAILLFGLFSAAAASEESSLVGVLYPDIKDGSPGSLRVDQSIRTTFATASSERIGIHPGYRGLSPVRNDCCKRFQGEFSRGNDAARKGDLVIPGLSSSLDLVQEHRKRIFSGAPLVFCAVDEREVTARNLPRDGNAVRPLSFWELYRWHSTGVLSVCVIQSLLIVGLLVERANRKRAEIALRESESRFRLMADAAPVMVWMSGPDKLCTYASQGWLEFTGRPLQCEIGDGWSEGVHPDDLQRCLDTYHRAFDARQRFRMEYRLRRFDGEYRWILDTGLPRFNTEGTFEGYIGSAIDITEEKQREEALRESQRDLAMLAGRLLQAQETERSRIARELHDDLGQSLALLSVEMDLLGQQPSESAAQVSERLQDLSARIKHLSSSVHDLSHELHPSKLEQLGLVAAVRALCKEWTQAHGVSIDFTTHQVANRIPEETALCLYRIVQEALRNVIKHSGARQASVELLQNADTFCLRIVDEGKGFDPRKVPRVGGLGFISMSERVYLVGGQISIDSQPTRGTRIAVQVPVRNGQREAAWPAHRAGRA
jgi:PAS domain S-box-containing protein